jgi:hypothetical protein
MDEYRVLEYLIKELSKLRIERADFIADGKAQDHAEYRHTCGVIRGLSLAEQTCKDLVQRLEKNNE